MLTKKKVDVYAALGEVIIKFIVGFASVIAFFWVLSYLISADTAFEAAKFGSMEVVLASTFYVLIGFYYNRSTPEKKRPILLYSTLIIAILALISSGVALVLILK